MCYKLSYDILIRNGRIVDGTGNPWFYADVGIKDDKIMKVGKIPEECGKMLIDATGFIVTPGFIDIHTHTGIFHLINPTGDSFIKQGVTTNVIGNCGSSIAPVSKFMKPRYEGRLARAHLEMDWVTFNDFFNIVFR